MANGNPKAHSIPSVIISNIPVPQIAPCQSLAFQPYFVAIKEPAVFDQLLSSDSLTSAFGVVTPLEIISKCQQLSQNKTSPSTTQRSTQTISLLLTNISRFLI